MNRHKDGMSTTSHTKGHEIGLELTSFVWLVWFVEKQGFFNSSTAFSHRF